jgi:TP901 family phage tail tape measure protein
MAAINLDIGGNTRRLDKDIQKTVNRVYAINLKTKGDQPLGRITGQVNEFNKSLAASNARVIAFGASAGLIFGLQRAFSALVSSTIEVQKSLQDINVILNVSTAQLNQFGSELFNIAKNTGQSFSEVAKAATEFSRQGLGVAETLKRTNEALILSRLSGLDTTKSVEALTAAVNSFASQAVTATEIVNKFANVDAAFAVSSKDLAEAISRVGSSASQSGVSLNELIAIVTSAQQTTARGGAVIGNSFKTIFTRLQRTKVVDLLSSLGVSETNASGQVKSTIQLLQDLAKVYDNLGVQQQAYIAEQVGGVFQINILKSALADLGKEFSVYNSALNVAGSTTDQAIRRNEELNKTYSAQINALRENAKQLATNAGGRVLGPTFERVVGGANELLGGVNESDGQGVGAALGKGILDGLGQILSGPGLILIGGVLLKLTKDFSVFATGSAKSLLGLNTAAEQQKNIQTSITQILAKNPDLLKLALKGEEGLNAVANTLLQNLRSQTVELQKQAQVAGQIAKAFYGAGVRISGDVPVVPTGGSTRGSTARPPGKAAGFIPKIRDPEIQAARGENYSAQRSFDVNNPILGPIRVNNREKTNAIPVRGYPAGSFVVNPNQLNQVRGIPLTPIERMKNKASGFIPNFAAPVEIEKIANSNPRVKNKLERSQKVNGELEANDTIQVQSIKSEYFNPNINKNMRTSGLSGKQYEQQAIDKVLKGKGWKSNKGLAWAGSSAIDGYRITGQTIELAEAKGGRFLNQLVLNKFLRAIPENYGSGNELDGLFKENSINRIDPINVKGILVQASKPNQTNITSEFSASSLERAKVAERADIAKYRASRSLRNAASGFIPNFAAPLVRAVDDKELRMMLSKFGKGWAFQGRSSEQSALEYFGGSGTYMWDALSRPGEQMSDRQAYKQNIGRAKNWASTRKQSSWLVRYNRDKLKDPEVLPDMETPGASVYGLPLSKDQIVWPIKQFGGSGKIFEKDISAFLSGQVKLQEPNAPARKAAMRQKSFARGYIPNFAKATQAVNLDGISTNRSYSTKLVSAIIPQPTNQLLKFPAQAEYRGTLYRTNDLPVSGPNRDVTKKLSQQNIPNLNRNIGKVIVDQANVFGRSLGATKFMSSASELPNLGGVNSAVGVAFEGGVANALGQSVGSKNARVDFSSPSLNPKIKKIFNNAPGSYEAKYRPSTPLINDVFSKFLSRLKPVKSGEIKAASSGAAGKAYLAARSAEVAKIREQFKAKKGREPYSKEINKELALRGIPSRAAGFIPNFAAEEDAKEREMSRAGSAVTLYSNMLRSPVVVNKPQIAKYGPNADKIIKKDHIDRGQVGTKSNLMKTGSGREKYKASGFIPNFAPTNDVTPVGVGDTIGALLAQVGILGLVLQNFGNDVKAANASILEYRTSLLSKQKAELQNLEKGSAAYNKLEKSIQKTNTSIQKLEKGNTAAAYGQAASSALLIAAPIIAETIKNAIGQETKAARVTGEVVSSTGNILSTAALAATIAPQGKGGKFAGIAAVATALLSSVGILKQLNTNLPELGTAAKEASEKLSGFSGVSQETLKTFEQISEFRGRGQAEEAGKLQTKLLTDVGTQVEDPAVRARIQTAILNQDSKALQSAIELNTKALTEASQKAEREVVIESSIEKIKGLSGGGVFEGIGNIFTSQPTIDERNRKREEKQFTQGQTLFGPQIGAFKRTNEKGENIPIREQISAIQQLAEQNLNSLEGYVQTLESLGFTTEQIEKLVKDEATVRPLLQKILNKEIESRNNILLNTGEGNAVIAQINKSLEVIKKTYAKYAKAVDAATKAQIALKVGVEGSLRNIETARLQSQAELTSDFIGETAPDSIRASITAGRSKIDTDFKNSLSEPIIEALSSLADIYISGRDKAFSDRATTGNEGEQKAAQNFEDLRTFFESPEFASAFDVDNLQKTLGLENFKLENFKGFDVDKIISSITPVGDEGQKKLEELEQRLTQTNAILAESRRLQGEQKVLLARQKFTEIAKQFIAAAKTSFGGFETFLQDGGYSELLKPLQKALGPLGISGTNTGGQINQAQELARVVTELSKLAGQNIGPALGAESNVVKTIQSAQTSEIKKVLDTIFKDLKDVPNGQELADAFRKTLATKFFGPEGADASNEEIAAATAEAQTKAQFQLIPDIQKRILDAAAGKLTEFDKGLGDLLSDPSAAFLEAEQVTQVLDAKRNLLLENILKELQNRPITNTVTVPTPATESGRGRAGGGGGGRRSAAVTPSAPVNPGYRGPAYDDGGFAGGFFPPVANTKEYVIPNFAQQREQLFKQEKRDQLKNGYSGGKPVMLGENDLNPLRDVIANPMQMALFEGMKSKKITAAGGYFPNFAENSLPDKKYLMGRTAMAKATKNMDIPMPVSLIAKGAGRFAGPVGLALGAYSLMDNFGGFPWSDENKKPKEMSPKDMPDYLKEYKTGPRPKFSNFAGGYFPNFANSDWADRSSGPKASGNSRPINPKPSPNSRAVTPLPKDEKGLRALLKRYSRAFKDNKLAKFVANNRKLVGGNLLYGVYDGLTRYGNRTSKGMSKWEAGVRSALEAGLGFGGGILGGKIGTKAGGLIGATGGPLAIAGAGAGGIGGGIAGYYGGSMLGGYIGDAIFGPEKKEPLDPVLYPKESPTRVLPQRELLQRKQQQQPPPETIGIDMDAVLSQGIPPQKTPTPDKNFGDKRAAAEKEINAQLMRWSMGASAEFKNYDKDYNETGITDLYGMEGEVAKGSSIDITRRINELRGRLKGSTSFSEGPSRDATARQIMSLQNRMRSEILPKNQFRGQLGTTPSGSQSLIDKAIAQGQDFGDGKLADKDFTGLTRAITNAEGKVVGYSRDNPEAAKKYREYSGAPGVYVDGKLWTDPNAEAVDPYRLIGGKGNAPATQINTKTGAGTMVPRAEAVDRSKLQRTFLKESREADVPMSEVYSVNSPDFRTPNNPMGTIVGNRKQEENIQELKKAIKEKTGKSVSIGGGGQFGGGGASGSWAGGYFPNFAQENEVGGKNINVSIGDIQISTNGAGGEINKDVLASQIKELIISQLPNLPELQQKVARLQEVSDKITAKDPALRSPPRGFIATT